MTGILLLTNADAGTNDDETLAAAMDVLRAGAEVEVCATSSPEELDDVCGRIGDRTVVVAGGDGSLHAVVNALHRGGHLPATPVGLIPLGTGNDFARGAGIPLDPAEAARLVLARRPVEVDLAVDSLGTVVVNNVHLGVGAQASREATVWKPRLGRLGYAVGALVAGLRPAFLRLDVEVDGDLVVSRRHRVAQVAIGNGTTVGGGTELTPEADPTDGLLDVLVSFAVTPAARLGYLVQLRRSRHHDREDVVYLRGSRVSVAGEAFWTSADGEITGPHRERSWRVEPAALRMVLGEHAPA